MKMLFFLEPKITSSLCDAVGSEDGKQTRTLTNGKDRHHNRDAEYNYEDVSIVLICGWSVGVLSQHSPSDSALCHMSVKRQHSHKTSTLRGDKLRALHKWVK